MFTLTGTTKRSFVLRQTLVHLLVLAGAASANGNNDSNNSRDSKDNNQQNYYKFNNDNVDLFSRVDTDVAEMWATAPSTWTAEYWEVLGGMIAMLLLIVAMLAFLCCAPICCVRNSGDGKITGKTTSTTPKSGAKGGTDDKKTRLLAVVEEQDAAEAGVANNVSGRQEGSPNFLTDDNVEAQTAPQMQRSCSSPVGRNELAMAKQQANSLAERKKHFKSLPLIPLSPKNNSKKDIYSAPVSQQSNAEEGTSVDPIIGPAPKTISSPTDRIKKTRQYRRTSLWSEVVSVWSDFLKHGFNGPIDDDAELRAAMSADGYRRWKDNHDDSRHQKIRRAKSSATAPSQAGGTPRRKSSKSRDRLKRSPSPRKKHQQGVEIDGIMKPAAVTSTSSKKMEQDQQGKLDLL